MSARSASRRWACEVRLVNGEVQVQGAEPARAATTAGPNDDAFADGWFRTGDLARVDADGFYEIVGRAKELIISGGENIHPAEIENIALADAAVAEAAVVGLPDARWGEVRGAGRRAARGLRRSTSKRLHAAFAAALARFKHPRRIVVLDALAEDRAGQSAQGRPGA